jgi:hypothetical protein
MPNIFSLLRGKILCRVLFTTVLVCLDHVSCVGDVDTKEFEALNLFHYSPVDEDGGARHLRTSSHVQLRPDQDKAKQCDKNNSYT